MDRDEILGWLREDDEQRLEQLWARADDARRRHVGDAVHLRGLVEFSNHCARQCLYCGLRAGNRRLRRYRMALPEIVECAQQAVQFGYGTVVLQSGEDWGARTEWVAELVRRLKAETPLAVTLSLGERDPEEFACWREAGADRYLLRFEASNRQLYDRLHPVRAGHRSDRIAILRHLRELGFEAGGGAMVGLPGQTYADLAADLELCRELDLDMIGLGPFIAHPDTPLGAAPDELAAPSGEQVPNTELLTYKAVALARLVCPEANIPSTTALATLNRAQGRELGLQRGANIVMPNLTPPQYRAQYEIYPAKACVSETAAECHRCLTARLRALGRPVGVGPGEAPRHRARRESAQPLGVP